MRRGHYIKLCTTIGNGSAHARARCLASGAMDTNKHASPCLGPEEKQAKKARLEEACEDDLYCEHVFASSQTQCLKAEYDGAVPYKHVVIDGLFRGAALRKVREQLIHAVKVDFKETDIFKVFQSGDLANLRQGQGSNAADISALLQLRDGLYSESFRKHVESIVGCPPLSSKVDCSCNVYSKGGHLLCHDDVIGTRCVSYILYLTDPDLQWTAANGGALELYPIQSNSEPDVSPSVNLLPAWNRMVLFGVCPGISFHSVQEVYENMDHRLSISGWFHSDVEPDAMQNASLRQLKLKEGSDTNRTFVDIACNTSGDNLPPNVREGLCDWVNSAYLSEEALRGIYEKFFADGSIQLQDFLVPSLIKKLQDATVEKDKKEFNRMSLTKYEVGIGDGWEAVGPPHKQRYLKFSGTCVDHSCGALMKSIQENLMHSPEFACLLHHMTGASPIGVFSEARRFRPGLDYTVAHFGGLSIDIRLDVVLCVVDDKDSLDEETWASGEVGGYEAYLLADENDGEKEADDVYKIDEDDGGVLSISPACNTLNIVLRDEGLMRFVKYVGASAPGSRWDIAAEYKLADPE